MFDLKFATETDWFALDACGNVAVFVSSFGPIPAELAWTDELASTITRALLSTPISSGIISHSSGLARADLSNLAARGLFAYAWSDYHGPYLKVVAPIVPMRVASLLQIQGATRLPMLPSILFDATARIDEIDIQNYAWFKESRVAGT